MTLADHLRDLRDVAYLLAGLAYYGVRKQTPASAYQSMIRMFTRTAGQSNDLISRGVSAIRPPKELPSHEGVLGRLTSEKRRAIVDQLDRDGFYVFEDTLPEVICDRLVELALQTPSVAQGAGTNGDAMLVYDRAAPCAVRYELEPRVLIANPDVQALLADWSIISVAQDYLRAAPVFDIVTMWWHTAFRDAPDARAAQFFHFDMDRPRWLKFFFYLTDVGPANGPHCFVRGSHRTGGIARDLLARGYARLTDEEVARHHSSSEYVRFVGKRGTIIAEDTRGLHKGQHVVSGDRLVFQIELANTLFGGAVPTLPLAEPVVAELRERMRAYPRLYSAFGDAC
jgi:ectoine hydroxylase-related dioxygenase (phytanoyl-CoA dioxygenase family)